MRRGERLLTSTWPEALDLVAERLLSARRRYGAVSVLHYWDVGSMGYLKNLYHRLFNLFGPVTEPAGSLCLGAGRAAQLADFGALRANPPEDVEKAGCVVIWGRNSVDTNRHAIPFIRTARSRGAPVIVVDPLFTATARELGDYHLAPRPGTDAVLALGAAGEIVRRGGADEVFCRRRGRGFEDYARVVSGLTSMRAAELCDVPESDLVRLAELLITHRPAAFLIGYGVQRHLRGAEAVRAIDALAAVAGSVGVSGGGANYADEHVLRALRDLTGFRRAATSTAMAGAGTRAAARAAAGAGAGARAGRTFERPVFGRQVRDLRDPPVEVVFVDRANPLAQLPNSREVAATWRRIPFKVTVDLRRTDTTDLSDVVLPAADFLEDEDLYHTAWHPYLTWALPAVQPPAEVRPEVWIISSLAERLGLGDEFRNSPAEWLAHALGPLVAAHPGLAPGGDPLALRGTCFANPAMEAVAWADGPFATESGRFEFGRRWPSLTDPGKGETKAQIPAGDTGDPIFHLITPQHRLSLHSQFYDRVLKVTSPRTGLPAVFAHPAAAGRLGLVAGTVVFVVSRDGELEAELVLDDGLREDTLIIYSGGRAVHEPGTGFPAGGEATPASANILTPDTLSDEGLQAAYYSCLCRLRPSGGAGRRAP